jgi:hypothetical protein
LQWKHPARLILLVAVASSLHCSGRARCATDADCDAATYCEVEYGLCVRRPDAGTPEVLLPEDAGTAALEWINPPSGPVTESVITLRVDASTVKAPDAEVVITVEPPQGEPTSFAMKREGDEHLAEYRPTSNGLHRFVASCPAASVTSPALSIEVTGVVLATQLLTPPFDTVSCTGQIPGVAIELGRSGTGSCVRPDGSLQWLSSNLPRVEAQGLLVEDSRTNLALKSEQFEHAKWMKVGGQVQQNSSLAPDGLSSADRFVVDGSLGRHGFRQSVSVTAGARYSKSVYLRATEGIQFARLMTPNSRAVYDLVSCVVTSASPETLATAVRSAASWCRVTLSFNGHATGTDEFAVDFGRSAAEADLDWTGDGDSHVELWGAQVEEGLATTSYISTDDAPVLRFAETALLPNPLTSADATWCLAATIDGASWPSAPGNLILNLGTRYAAKSSATLMLDDKTGRARISVFDEQEGYRYVIGPKKVGPGRHRVRACNNEGALSLSVDGEDQGQPAGQGSGKLSDMPGVVAIGGLPDRTAGGFNGHLSEICISPSLDGCL